MPSPSPAHTKGFIAGFLSATISVYFYHKVSSSQSFNLQKKKSRTFHTFFQSEQNEDFETNKIAAADGEEPMDSPDLPLRMIRKAETAILRRTSRIIVVIERCTNEHNYSAILRTVEALGIQNVWIISPPEATTGENSAVMEDNVNINTARNESNLDPGKIQSFTGKIIQLTNAEMNTRINHHIFAQKAAEWLSIREFDNTTACLEALKQDNREIWATDLSQKAVCLTKEGLFDKTNSPSSSENDSIIPQRLAIVFGTEAVGCSTEMLSSAHRRVYLPLHGFADSLNLSVATALCLLQLFHLEPNCVGSMSEAERKMLRKSWYTKLARQRIMTSGQKKNRGKMVGKVKKIEEIERKKASGIGELTKEQEEKLRLGEKLRQQLSDFDEKINNEAEKSVADLIENPPLPLSDVSNKILLFAHFCVDS